MTRPSTIAASLLTALVLGMVIGSRAPVAEAQSSPYTEVSQLARVLVLVENHYVQPVERHKLLEGAIKGMVSELDPHSAYLPPEDFKLFQSETEGTFVGVGIEVDARGEVITVISPIEGSPAERSGILPGDKIVSVDGQPTRGMPLERVVRKIRGLPGTTVRLGVERGGTLHNFVLTRSQIRVDSVVTKRLKGGVGYVRIKQFQQNTHTDFLRAVGAWRTDSAGPVTGVLLDLRTNPGGLVDEAAAVADELLDSGGIYSTRARGRVLIDVQARGGGALVDVPVVVLVNEFSASAAELVAGALQDQRRAVVVGAQTFGKGSVQSIVELPGSAGLKLTTMLYYTPNGRLIQAHGIQPDVLVPAPGGTSPFVVRERDIEGHIPGELTDIAPATPAPMSDVDGGAAPPPSPIISRDIPTDPSRGDDLVLSIGYRILTGVLNAPKPEPRR